MRRITSTDLTNWAPSRDCQGHLPLLIRKLIRASNVIITKILIPVGDNVNLPGYDGTLEVIKGTEYIPEGLSVWEIGSGRDFKAKAERDYTTRTDNIDIAEAAKASFIFVTPYVWTDKDTWIKGKEEKKIWKNVSVIDGLNIEDWLEQLPIVGAWLAKHLQVPFANIQPLESFWNEWSTNLKYSIPPTLVISGRENEIERLKLFLFNTPGIISIKSFTTEETIAFCAATIEKLDDDKKEEFYSRAIIVDNEQDFRLVCLSSHPIILIAKFEIGSLVNQAVRNGHHVIIPLSIDITAAQSDIDLPRIKRKGFEAGLKQMDFVDEEVENLIRNSGQSLSVLRRLLQFERYQQPDWAKNGHHSDILPALMAGMWNEFKEGDQSIISILAGKTYEQYIFELTRWKNEKDPPILQIRGIWRTTSALDAWAILAPFITKFDLERFRNVFITVFSEIDPALEVNPEIRYFASSFLGKSTEFSFSLKEGLCQSLILIAVFGSKFRLIATASAQSFADALVREVLFGATTDVWCSLSQFLPLLSEASPVSFLDAVEDSLNKEDTPVMGMFGNMHNVLSSSTYHSYLLFALESLMSSSDYLLRTTLILGKLTRLDPGGNTANRPGNTLKAAYVAWYNQLNVEFSLKKCVLEQLVSAEPAVAWDLFISISSINNSSVSPINRCKWRFDSQLIDRNVSYEKLFEFNSFVFEQLIILANGDEFKTSKLIGLYPYIKPDERKKLLKFIRDSKDIYNYRQDIIWKQLKRVLFHHSNHTDKEEGLPYDELVALEDTCDYYLPIDLKERYKSLFDEPWIFHDVPRIKELPFEKRNELMEEKRKDAYEEIYVSEGFSGILKLQEMLKDSNNLARTSAHYPLIKDEEKCILKLLNKDDTHSLDFVQRYIFFKAINDTGQWISWAWQVINELYSDKKTLANFFLFLPQNGRYGWDLLDTVLDDDISALYWKQVHISFFTLENKDKLFAFDKLLAVNRPYIVIDAVADIVDDLTTGQLIDILSRAANTQSQESIHLHSSDVGTIFESLDSRSDIDADQLFNLEWQYLSYLTDRYGTYKPENIFYKLTTNPVFFVDIVCYAYLPDQNKALDTYTEEELDEYFKHSKSARKLLDIWRSIPGVNDNGIIDLKILLSWIERSRQRAIEVDRTSGVDREIGKLLARFPRNNVAWPRDEICEVIDRINSDILLSAFRTEIFNSRGLTSRNPYDGGQQERALASYFDQMGKRIQAKYPKTASVLFSLAQHYQIDAQREDDNAYLDELR